MDGKKVLMTSKMFKTAKSEKFHLKIGHSWNDLQWDQDLPKKPQAPPPPAAINSLSKTIVQSLWNLTDEDLIQSADLFSAMVDCCDQVLTKHWMLSFHLCINESSNYCH